MNTNMMAKSLGLSPTTIEHESIGMTKLTMNSSNQASANADFELARQSLLDLIHNSQQAINTLSQIANQSQDAEAFSSLASLMNTLINANRQLMELQKRIRDIKKDDAGIESTDKTTNNNLFVGTSQEMLKLIRGE